MTELLAFPERIRERFPEGLTGILAIGGTRITYVLDYNSQVENPGRIENMQGYGDEMSTRMQTLIQMFFQLGGQHVIIPLLSYQLFSHSRGQEYAELTARMALDLLGESWTRFYLHNAIDPYFVGIDTLIRFPQHALTYKLGTECARFNQEWKYQQGRHKLIWEIAPIPLFSLWQAHTVMGAQAQQELEAALAAAPDMQTLHDTLYSYYARALYGTDVPMPHFYLGNNRNGDLKLRAMLPIALACGSPMRLFYTPYPSMYITRETLQAMLEDLAFGKPLRSTQTDYSGQLTPELVARERDRVMKLRSDPLSTIGMIRSSESETTTPRS